MKPSSSVLFLFVFIPFVLCVDWYISPEGSNDSGNGSEENPWLTLDYATSQATDGDTIYLLPGMYFGSENYPLVTANITYEGIKSNSTLIGSGTESCFTAKGPFVNLTVKWMEVRDCSVGFDLLSGADLSLRGLLVSNNSIAIRIDDDETPQRVQVGLTSIKDSAVVASTTDQAKSGLTFALETSSVENGTFGRANYVFLQSSLTNVSVSAKAGYIAGTNWVGSSLSLDLEDSDVEFRIQQSNFGSSYFDVTGGKLSLISGLLENSDRTCLSLDGTKATLSFWNFVRCGNPSENGGGVRMINEASLTGLNVGFSENTALNGGGIYCQDSTFSLWGPFFDQNTAAQTGSSPDAQCNSCTSSTVYAHYGDQLSQHTNCVNDHFQHSTLF